MLTHGFTIAFSYMSFHFVHAHPPPPLPCPYPHASMPLWCSKLLRVSWEEESLKMGRLMWKSSTDTKSESLWGSNVSSGQTLTGLVHWLATESKGKREQEERQSSPLFAECTGRSYSTWHKLESSERRELAWENASLRYSCKASS